MNSSERLVNILLEADDLPPVTPGAEAAYDPDSPDISDIKDEIFAQCDRENAEDAAGILNRRTAMTASRFYHRTALYKDGIRHIEARRNGATKTWVRRPNEFRIPVKYGMYDCFYITDKDASNWSTVPIPDKEKPVKRPSTNQLDLPI